MTTLRGQLLMSVCQSCLCWCSVLEWEWQGRLCYLQRGAAEPGEWAIKVQVCFISITPLPCHIMTNQPAPVRSSSRGIWEITGHCCRLFGQGWGSPNVTLLRPWETEVQVIIHRTLYSIWSFLLCLLSQHWDRVLAHVNICRGKAQKRVAHYYK